jgi:hypothetical protein
MKPEKVVPGIPPTLFREAEYILWPASPSKDIFGREEARDSKSRENGTLWEIT